MKHKFFSAVFFCFRVSSPYGMDGRTDGQTDRQTGKTRIAACYDDRTTTCQLLTSLDCAQLMHSFVSGLKLVTCGPSCFRHAHVSACWRKAAVNALTAWNSNWELPHVCDELFAVATSSGVSEPFAPLTLRPQYVSPLALFRSLKIAEYGEDEWTTEKTTLSPPSVFTRHSTYIILAIVILSVRLSDTSRYRFKPRWDRDSGFLPYDSVETDYSFLWATFVPLGEEIPLEQGHQRGVPPKISLSHRY